MKTRIKIKLYLMVLAIISITILLPASYIWAQDESSDCEIFDTGRLIPYSDCPYEFTIDIKENFTRVEISHYGQEGSTDKFGGWKAWLKVNGELIYEWLDWDSDTGATWYDYTEQSYYYDNESRSDLTAHFPHPFG